MKGLGLRRKRVDGQRQDVSVSYPSTTSDRIVLQSEYFFESAMSHVVSCFWVSDRINVTDSFGIKKSKIETTSIVNTRDL